MEELERYDIPSDRPSEWRERRLKRFKFWKRLAAFWSGEEQGYMGSREYVKLHLATRPEPTDPEQLALPTFARERTWPIQPLPGHAKVSAYFNIDNGGGQIRGIYAEENAVIVPIFEPWFASTAVNKPQTRRHKDTKHNTKGFLCGRLRDFVPLWL